MCGKKEIYQSDFNYKIVGKNIKKYRKAAKISQAELAEAAHISISHLSKIENGHYKSHFHNFVEIAEALNISLYDLIGKENLHNDSAFEMLVLEKSKHCSENQKNLSLILWTLFWRKKVICKTKSC